MEGTLAPHGLIPVTGHTGISAGKPLEYCLVHCDPPVSAGVPATV
jgi:hypothetical protein